MSRRWGGSTTDRDQPIEYRGPSDCPTWVLVLLYAVAITLVIGGSYVAWEFGA